MCNQTLSKILLFEMKTECNRKNKSLSETNQIFKIYPYKWIKQIMCMCEDTKKFFHRKNLKRLISDRNW